MKMQRPVRVTPPSSALLTLAEAKAQCRIEHSHEDTLIASLVQAATDYLDGYTGVLGRALLTQAWKVTLSAWPQCIRLPVGPAQTVTAITYFDSANASQTLPGANYALLEDIRSPYVVWKANAVLPVLYDRDDAVAVTFVAGYGDLGDVPEPIRHAARLLVGHFYENREAVNVGNIVTAFPLAVQALIAPFRRVGL